MAWRLSMQEKTVEDIQNANKLYFKSLSNTRASASRCLFRLQEYLY